LIIGNFYFLPILAYILSVLPALASPQCAIAGSGDSPLVGSRRHRVGEAGWVRLGRFGPGWVGSDQVGLGRLGGSGRSVSRIG
jgi:hypothetical protein